MSLSDLADGQHLSKLDGGGLREPARLAEAIALPDALLHSPEFGWGTIELRPHSLPLLTQPEPPARTPKCQRLCSAPARAMYAGDEPQATDGWLPAGDK